MANKIHGGTIQAELTANVSDYMSGLGQATQAAMQFQRTTSGISFQGFNRGIIATTTLLYGMNRIMSQMSQGMEEFSNVLARIGAVSDLTAESVRNLADSMKGISVAYGVGRTDIMKAMYTTAQSRFTKPSEMRFFGSQAAMLSRASGKEIDATGAAKLMTGLVRSLGLDVKKDVASGMLSDMLLKSRDIGRWELREMAPAIAKVATVFGNEFAGRLGGVETLRQMNAIMAVASGTDLPLGMVSTGVRRLVERSYQLRGTKRGEYLRSQLAGLGYDPRDPIQGALQKGPLFYLKDLARLSGGSPMELYRLGFQSRELAAVSAALQGKGSQLMSAYQQMSPSGIAGTTGQYTDKMKGTYEFQRDQLRAQWMLTSQEFMQASVPAIRSLTDVLTMLNKVAQALPTSVKQMMGLVAMLSSLRFALNLFGVKGSIFGISSARMTGGGRFFGGGGGGGGSAQDLLGAMTAMAYPGRTTGDIYSMLEKRLKINSAAAHGIVPGFGGTYMLRGDGGRFTGATTSLSDALEKNVASLGEKPSMMRQIGRRMAIRDGLAPLGVSLTREGYKSMGVSPLANSAAAAGAAIGRFTSGLTSMLAPMAKFTAAMWVVSKVVEGAAYRRSDAQTIDGMTRLGGRKANQIGAATYLFGANLASIANRFTGGDLLDRGEIWDQVARKYGYIADPDSPNAFGRFASWWHLGSMDYAGMRQATPDDVLAEAWRTQLTGAQRGALLRGGIDPTKFSTLEPHLKKSMAESNMLPPEDWTKFIAGVGGFDRAVELATDALKRFATQTIEAAATARQALIDMAMGRLTAMKHGYDMSNLFSLDAIRRDFGSNAIMFDRQMDLYKGGTRGSPDPVSDAIFGWRGGRNKAAYAASMSHLGKHLEGSGAWMDTYNGKLINLAFERAAQENLLVRERSMGLHQLIKHDITQGVPPMFAKEKMSLVYGNEAWPVDKNMQPMIPTDEQVRRALAGRARKRAESSIPKHQLAGMDAELETMSRYYDIYKNKLDWQGRGMKFMGALPNWASMGDDAKRALFSELTGMSEGHAFYESGLSRFMGTKPSDYFDMREMSGRARYESATEFGSSQAYNELLQRDDPVYQIDPKLDEGIGYLKQLAEPTQEEIDDKFPSLITAAAKFFDQAEHTQFFKNIQDMAATEDV